MLKSHLTLVNTNPFKTPGILFEIPLNNYCFIFRKGNHQHRTCKGLHVQPSHGYGQAFPVRTSTVSEHLNSGF